MKEVCDKCYYGTVCERPCRPVELYLKEGNLSVWTKKSIDKNGREIEVIYSRSRERQQSTLSEGFDKRGDPRLSEREQLAFSTENQSPFAHFKPELLQTGIFVDRFFYQMSYSDLAVKYEMSEDDCIKRYSYGVKRIMELLKAMDNPTFATKQVDYWKKKVDERSGSLPKGQKWYLLNKLFGLSPSQICELEGMKGSSSVRQLIIRVSDQLAAGEIKLIEVTPEESAAAKARLEAHNAKRRERHAKKKR
jgi:hypothetical protein